MKFGKNCNSLQSPKKLEIICTLGTTTDDKNVLLEMIRNGMTYARINTAYATCCEYKQRIDLLRSISKVPIILDLKGSQLRLVVEEPSPGKPKRYCIDVGDEFPVGFRKGSIAFNHDISKDIKPGDQVLFENGTIKTMVLKKEKTHLLLKVIESGERRLINNMGVNIPGRIFSDIPLLTTRDLENIEFALKECVEFLAISFTRNSEDVFNLMQEIDKRKKGSEIPQIIIKIEDPIGVSNLEQIIKDARSKNIELVVMIGRGDMFIEADKYKLPFIQKQIIVKCQELRVPVIVATGLLESMQYSIYPTRSEVCDVANSIMDGADGLMLSAETSNSAYPAEAVKILNSIIQEYLNC